MDGTKHKSHRWTYLGKDKLGYCFVDQFYGPNGTSMMASQKKVVIINTQDNRGLRVNKHLSGLFAENPPSVSGRSFSGSIPFLKE